MTSVQRSNFKSVGRGRGHQSLGRGQSQGGMSSSSSSDRQEGHSRSRDSYYGSSGHGGTPQHSSYPYESNWRAHSGNNSRSFPRTSQTPPTPESPSQPSVIEDETVRFIAEAWHEVEYEMRHPKDGLNPPVTYQEKTPRSRPDFEPFDLEGWHAQRVDRY